MQREPEDGCTTALLEGLRYARVVDLLIAAGANVNDQVNTQSLAFGCIARNFFCEFLQQ
jgi:hypothetical protein